MSNLIYLLGSLLAFQNAHAAGGENIKQALEALSDSDQALYITTSDQNGCRLLFSRSEASYQVEYLTTSSPSGPNLGERFIIRIPLNGVQMKVPYKPSYRTIKVTQAVATGGNLLVEVKGTEGSYGKLTLNGVNLEKETIKDAQFSNKVGRSFHCSNLKRH